MTYSRFRCALPLVALVAVGAGTANARPSDETSSGDKLRILYSSRFTFTDDGLPLVTVEVMGGRETVRLSSRGPVIALPDGEGGAEVVAESEWTITRERASAARLVDWVIVSRLDADDQRAAQQAVRRWTGRGYKPRRFETGTLFGVDGEVIDSREVLIGVAPRRGGGGLARARAIGRKYKIRTSLHRELSRRPAGTIVARSGKTVIRNPSVIWFAPSSIDRHSSKSTLTVHNVPTGTGGSQIETGLADRRYFGQIYVTIGADGKLTVANAVSADALLAGLVPSEMYPSAPMEALKAQAVAARTELIEKLGARHFGDPFLLCSTQHCQVYSGAGEEHPRTTRAVRNTRGLVVLRSRGGLADTRYSASCGGHSEHNDHIWGGEADPSLRGHVDAQANTALARSFARVTDANIDEFLASETGAYCASTRYSEDRYRWTKRLSQNHINRRVAASYPGVGEVIALQPLSRGVSGRISALRIRGRSRTVVARGDLFIRRLFDGLRSTLFTVKKNGDAFVFRGGGFGHGVGMCQIGAIGMARGRTGFRKILNHYYPHTRTRRLY